MKKVYWQGDEHIEEPGTAPLIGHGIIIHAINIFGRGGMRSILQESSNPLSIDRIVLSYLMDGMSEIDGLSRFPKKQKLASYSCLLPEQIQSGNGDVKGHITKHGPSLFGFTSLTAAHVIIRYSKRMRAKYLSIIKRSGKNSPIVAIARILLECIHFVLTGIIEFKHNMGGLAEQKMKTMLLRANKPGRFKDLEEVEKEFMKKRDQHKTDQLIS